MLNEIRIIGDVHGDAYLHRRLKENAVRSIQIGDMGVGFGLNHCFEFLPDKDFFFNGNHDNPDECKTFKSFLGTCGSSRAEKLFWCGGGYSIDWAYRIPGVSWWENEELPVSELEEVIDQYIDFKPDIMLSHEAPDFLGPLMLQRGGGLPGAPYRPSRTALALQAMYEAHQPKIWLYGHWHMDFEFQAPVTKFLCVNQNQSIDLNVETCQAGSRVSLRQI
ncbi:MAG: hypothetical protein KGI54_17230 [Pseudomonadota bacterium]|nr:hypothetical protein [Pseudomonadota bacterium]